MLCHWELLGDLWKGNGGQSMTFPFSTARSSRFTHGISNSCVTIAFCLQGCKFIDFAKAWEEGSSSLRVLFLPQLWGLLWSRQSIRSFLHKWRRYHPSPPDKNRFIPGKSLGCPFPGSAAPNIQFVSPRTPSRSSSSCLTSQPWQGEEDEPSSEGLACHSVNVALTWIFTIYCV